MKADKTFVPAQEIPKEERPEEEKAISYQGKKDTQTELEMNLLT